jgi:hypothetical protein
MGRGLDSSADSSKTTQSVLVDSGSVSGWAHSGLRGWRMTMEDSVVAEQLSAQVSAFAVFDGHGGDFCSRWSAIELPNRLRSSPILAQTCVNETEEVQTAATSLGDSLRSMDEDLRRELRKSWACGTTAVALLVSPRCLTVANLGDSRAVLCRKGDPLPMSKDHKPRSPAERHRILEAGAAIIDGRVNGDLALSRGKRLLNEPVASTRVKSSDLLLARCSLLPTPVPRQSHSSPTPVPRQSHSSRHVYFAALGDFRHKNVAGLCPAKQPVRLDELIIRLVIRPDSQQLLN